jgi:hypothetical protein
MKTIDGKTMPARRWAWMQFFGPITPGFVITNTCQNKACVNPWHLRMCTQAEANRGSVQTILLARRRDRDSIAPQVQECRHR